MKAKFFLIYYLTLCLVLSACSNDDSTNSISANTVKACFEQTIDGGIVTFNSECSEFANEWQWEFGDGSTSIAQNPEHEYNSDGE